METDLPRGRDDKREIVEEPRPLAARSLMRPAGKAVLFAPCNRAVPGAPVVKGADE